MYVHKDILSQHNPYSKDSVKTLKMTQETLKIYEKNFKILSPSLLYINLNLIDIEEEKIEASSALSKKTTNELQRFLYKGGLVFPLPVTKLSNGRFKVVAYDDKINAMKHGLTEHQLKKIRILCYDVDTIKQTDEEMFVLVPSYYYEVIHFKDFYFNVFKDRFYMHRKKLKPHYMLIKGEKRIEFLEHIVGTIDTSVYRHILAEEDLKLNLGFKNIIYER